MQSIRNKLTTSVWSLPIPYQKESSFLNDGKITKEEFERAGDNLCSKNKSWKWASGDPKKENKNLKPDKQYLVFKKAQCKQRASAFIEEFENHREEDDFIVTNTLTANDLDKLVTSLDDANLDEGEEVILEDDATNEEVILEDDATNTEQSSSTTSATNQNESDKNDLVPVKGRSYDISITYNNYYRSPQIWLIGKDEEDNYLPPNQMFEDVQKDYQRQTITIENHPHLESQYKHLSIHPCRHASTIHSIREGSDFPVEEYFFTFLKFVQTVIPTIEYDFTRQVSYGL